MIRAETLTLAEVAAVLGISKPNVRKFLERRGVQPVITTHHVGPLWHADVIRGIKTQRDADHAARDANARRRAAQRERAKT